MSVIRDHWDHGNHIGVDSAMHARHQRLVSDFVKRSVKDGRIKHIKKIVVEFNENVFKLVEQIDHQVQRIARVEEALREHCEGDEENEAMDALDDMLEGLGIAKSVLFKYSTSLTNFEGYEK